MNVRNGLLLLLCLFTLQNLRAQMVPTQSGVFLYFDPAVIQKNKIRYLYISQYEKYLGKKKSKLSRPFSKSEVLFDSTGLAYSIVHLWNGGTDTVKLHGKYELPKFSTKPYRVDDGPNNSKIYWIGQGREEQMLIFDTLGNEIVNEEVYKPVDVLAYVRRHISTYDAKNRLVMREFTQSDLNWNQAERDWDTLPKMRSYEKYIYENERLTRIDVFSDDTPKPSHSMVFTYSKEGILTRVEGANEYSKQHPVRLVLRISATRNDEPFEPMLKTPQ